MCKFAHVSKFSPYEWGLSCLLVKKSWSKLKVFVHIDAETNRMTLAIYGTSLRAIKRHGFVKQLSIHMSFPCDKNFHSWNWIWSIFQKLSFWPYICDAPGCNKVKIWQNLCPIFWPRPIPQVHVMSVKCTSQTLNIALCKWDENIDKRTDQQSDSKMPTFLCEDSIVANSPPTHGSHPQMSVTTRELPWDPQTACFTPTIPPNDLGLLNKIISCFVYLCFIYQENCLHLVNSI